MCVKLTLPPRERRRWLLITTRLSASSLAGTARTLVAVGTVSEVCMFATTRADAPRRLRSWGSCRRAGLHGAVRGPVVGEEVVPGGVDALGVGQEALVHLLDEPLVGAEVGARHRIGFACRLFRRRHVVRPPFGVGCLDIKRSLSS